MERPFIQRHRPLSAVYCLFAPARHYKKSIDPRETQMGWLWGTTESAWNPHISNQVSGTIIIEIGTV